MLRLRENVFTADREGSDVNKALSELQLFIVSHTNTALPKLGDQKAIQLKYTYERLVAEKDKALAAARKSLNSDATEYCQKKYSSSSFEVRSNCVQEYFAEHPILEASIPAEMYSYDFITPLWTTDIAGLSIMVFGIFGVVLFYRLVSWLVIRKSLKKINY